MSDYPRINVDRPHGGLPAHVDLIMPIDGIGSHKVRVGPDAGILSDEVLVSRRLLDRPQDPNDPRSTGPAFGG